MQKRSALLWVCLAVSPSSVFAYDVVIGTSSKRVALLELYTSEGCSSCPPADRWLSRLQDDPRLWREVVPVAFHVDYWDYIGWKDRFASPLYGKRQREYSRQGYLKAVYTPGLVLAGREWRAWFRSPVLVLEDALEVGELSVEMADGRGAAVYSPAEISDRSYEVHVALLGFGLETEVRAGENRGRKLTHDFAVLAYHRAPTIDEDGKHRASFTLSDPGIPSERHAIALWVGAIGDPSPIQAAGAWLD